VVQYLQLMRFASMNSRFAAAVAVLIVLAVFGARVARSQILGDVLILKSGEKVEGRITTESEMSVVISTETATGKTERMIARSDISSITRTEPLAPSPMPSGPEIPEQTFTSPDKKWEFSDGDTAKLVKAGTDEMAVDFSEECDLGALDEHSEILWAPDSKRLAFYSCGAGKEHNTLLYQLRDGKWVALEGPRDELFQRAGKIIEAQAKRKGLPKKTFLHMQWWTVKPERWLDSSTLIVYASMAEVVHRYDGAYAGLNFGADLLVTLKLDTAGNWKIVKTHEMSEKEVQKREKEQ
jgi:hypothetical protein